jgi:hypothetical protein
MKLREIHFVAWTQVMALFVTAAASGQDFKVSGSMTLQSFTQSGILTQYF